MVVRSNPSVERQYTSWDRARLSVVVPIGVIVAVAIVCIVVAVLSSAQRADEVAVDHEMSLFSTALNNYGAGMLREVESVASSGSAIANIRVKFDADWAKDRVGACSTPISPTITSSSSTTTTSRSIRWSAATPSTAPGSTRCGPS